MLSSDETSLVQGRGRKESEREEGVCEMRILESEMEGSRRMKTSVANSGM